MKVHLYLIIASASLLVRDIHLAGACTRLAIDLAVKQSKFNRRETSLSLCVMQKSGVITPKQRQQIAKARRRCSNAIHGGNPQPESIREAIRWARELQKLE